MEFEGIGIGISDFKALRLRKNYFIDKTMFIKDIVDNQAGVLLVTRPRRFGKTLNMSMLRYFFDCDVKARSVSMHIFDIERCKRVKL